MKTISFAVILVAALAMSAFAADFDIKQESEFKKLLPTGLQLRKLTGGMKFVEGPVWIPRDGGFLVFSDIPADELKKWDGQKLTTFRQPSFNANGNTLDRKGNLLTCEHTGRRVSAQGKDGQLTTMVDRFEKKKFNSPNDVVVKSDGTVWFTDPDYGLGSNPKEMDGNYVFRYVVKTKKIAAVVKDCDQPNGLCFSPDEKKIYIADSGKPHHIRVFDVNKDGTLDNGKVFCVIDNGVPDGIRCDENGNVWSSAGDGVQIFSPSGALIGKILVPESPANLCFGGRDFKTVFITARTSLYSIDVGVRGAK